jgi:Flp pilus assembly protein TadD
MAREAERDGNAFAAIWHLDRLIAARPDDWLLLARRAHAWCRSGRFDRAGADYEQAGRLVDREAVLDFQDHRAVECIDDGRWAEALWHLDRLIAARPDDGPLHELRASACGKLGREADRRAELARVFELGADEGLVLPRAEELGRDGRWPEAASLLARCGREGPLLGKELAQAWAIACLRAGDRAGYREACAAFVAREGPDPTVVWNALRGAWLLALAPGAVEDDRAPIAWFEKRLAATPSPSPLYRHLISSGLGGLLLRAGRVDEAIAVLDGGISAAKEIEIPADWAYLALAHAQKGRLAEARRWLDRLRAVRPAPGDPFWEIQELSILRDEAESSLLDAAFPSDPFDHPGLR